VADFKLNVSANWPSLVDLKIVSSTIAPNLIFQTPFPGPVAFDGSSASVTIPVTVGPAFGVAPGVYTFTIQVVGLDGGLAYTADALNQTILTVNVD